MKQPPTLDVEISTEQTVRGAPTDEQKLALVKRIAESSHFRRSARLCDFLLYVSRQGIKNPAAEIHEQEIGAKVFGRSPHYDRSQDNIVRVNATELRKRIDLYYATEGIDEALAVAIPRGGYMPVFDWRSPENSAHPAETLDKHELGVLSSTEGSAQLASFASSPARASRALQTNARRWPWIAATITLAIACVGLLWALLRSTKSPDARSAPTVMAFWSDFARGNQTDIVLPDESISVMEDLLKHPIPLSDYLDRSYVTGLASVPVSEDRKADVRELLNHNLVTLGSVNAAKEILLLPGLAPKFHLTVSRFYPADAMKRNNAVFIGGKKSNPWVSLFEPAMNFTVDYDSAHSQAYVTNHHPKPGEQAAYLVSMSRNALVGYSVLAFLPNESDTGEVVIVAGTDSDATAAAADFVTSEEHLSKLKERLHVSRLPYFELLLKTSRLSGTSLGSELVAYRTYGAAR